MAPQYTVRSVGVTLATLAGLLPGTALGQVRPAPRNPTIPMVGVPAGEIMDYVVRPGDTCAAIARRLYTDPARIDLIHTYNPGMGPVPHHLVAGTVLRVPRHAPAGVPLAPDARLTFVRNAVEAFTPEQHPGRINEALGRGHRVNTEAASSAEVTFRDETQIQLGEHTLVVIYGDSNALGPRRVTPGETTLVRGTLRAHLDELLGTPVRPPTVTLATPAAQAVLGRGESLVDVDTARVTRLSVYRGHSQLRTARATVNVPAGFGSRAEAGRPPTVPRPLPGAPRWVTLPSHLVLANGEAGATATADAVWTYAPGEGHAVTAWHVQVARDAAFNDLVTDARVPVDVTRLEARGLQAGTWHARVSAVDAEHFEGPPSTLSDIVVAAPRLAPSSPLLATLEIPVGVVCGLDGGPLGSSPPPPLVRSVAHRLRCALASDPVSAGDLELPPRPPPGLALNTGWLQHPSPVTRSAGITLALVDALGHGVPVQSVTATGTDGALLGPLTPSGSAGHWVTTVSWPRGLSHFTVQLTADGTPVQSAVVSLPVDAAPDSAAPVGASRWSLRAELGAGTVLSSWLPAGTEPGVGLVGTARLGLTVHDPLAVDLSLGAVRYGRTAGDVVLPALSVGVRVEPRVGTLGRLWLDAHGGVSMSDGVLRAMADGGLGVEFALSRTVALGPYGRYTRYFQTADGVTQGGRSTTTQDLQAWSAGVSLTVGAPPR